MTLENSGMKQTCKGNGDFTIIDGILVEYLGNDSSVVIPDGVIKINDCAFRNHYVTSVSIPVTVKKINEYAFHSLTDIHYAGTREQWNNVRKSIYWRKSADVVHCIDGDVELPKFDIRGNVLVHYYGVADSIIIPNGVTEIGDRAFMQCESLKSIVIPDSVMEIGESAFHNCESLEFISIPSNVQKINKYLFNRCTSLKSVSIPASVKKICSYAFNDCPVLAEIHFAGTKKQWSFVKKDKNWRRYIPASSIECTDDSVEIPQFRINAGVLEQYYGVSDSVVIPNNVMEIGNCAFDDCETLLSVSIPDNVIEIGAAAFRGCRSLKSISIPEGVMEIHDSTFIQCISLESVSIPKSVRIIEENAFRACVSLSSIVVPDGVIKIYDKAFFDCMHLVSINIPASVTEIGENAFWGCQSLKEIHYGGTEEQWNALVKGDCWNEDCPDLKIIFD